MVRDPPRPRRDVKKKAVAAKRRSPVRKAAGPARPTSAQPTSARPARSAQRQPAQARSTGRRVTGVVLRAIGFVVLLWVGGFTWFVATRPGAAPLALTTDAVVVLTGGPGRLARGAEVLGQGAAKRMLVSGVGPHVRKAELAARIDAPQRLFAQDVDLGFAAVDTRSNAIETTAWMARHGYRSLRLVTSTAHMKRAQLELEAQLPRAIRIVPDGVPVESGADSLAREFTKYGLRRAALMVGAA